MDDKLKILLEIDPERSSSQVVIQAPTAAEGQAIMNDLLGRSDTRGEANLSIKVDDSIYLVPKEEIIYAEIFAKELRIVTIDKTYETRGSLSGLLEKLPADGFIQVSRSAVINVKMIVRLDLSFIGNVSAHLKNGDKVYVSRRSVENLRRVLGIGG